MSDKKKPTSDQWDNVREPVTTESLNNLHRLAAFHASGGNHPSKREELEKLVVDQGTKELLPVLEYFGSGGPGTSLRPGLETGKVVEGTVTEVQDCSAFVDLGGGAVGLAHRSDLTWDNLPADEVVRVGQRVRVKILHNPSDSRVIHLGMKQVEDPARAAEEESRWSNMPKIEVVKPPRDWSWLPGEVPGIIGKQAIYHEGFLMRVRVHSAHAQQDHLGIKFQRMSWDGATTEVEAHEISTGGDGLIAGPGLRLIMYFHLPWTLYIGDQIVQEVSSLILAEENNRAIRRCLSDFKRKHWPSR